jgi:enamine deaminase RidA (YjgF/YER057c/UK114 family)
VPSSAGTRDALFARLSYPARMTDRQNISSGSKWEPLVGYSRAVRVGHHVSVSGTAPAGPDGAVVGAGNPYLQAQHCLKIIVAALEQAGASPKDVVRTRIFTTDVSAWQEIGRAHAEVFADIRPATTMVEVRALVDPLMLVEIEADAIVGE